MSLTVHWLSDKPIDPVAAAIIAAQVRERCAMICDAEARSRVHTQYSRGWVECAKAMAKLIREQQ